MQPMNGDFCHVAQFVRPEDQALLGRVRAFAEAKVAPIINQHGGARSFHSS
jgi:hypothetical protein